MVDLGHRPASGQGPNEERSPGQRASATPDPLGPFEAYIRARFADDHHLWATALFEEVAALGYARSYPTFARQIRLRSLLPHCEACRGVAGRETIEIDHPPGEEIQWDWFERRRAPWGSTAFVLLGTLPHSGRTRGVLAASMDQEAMDRVMRRVGGTARIWRTDRLATVIVPGTSDVQPSFAPVAKHYGAVVAPCPPRRGNRKGAVESAVRYVCGRWWRTMSAATPEQAQRSLDRFLATSGDLRVRRDASGAKTTVGALADAERLLALPPAPYPVTLELTRIVGANATVAFRGDRYSVPPGLAGSELRCRHRLGSKTLEICSASGALVATHRLGSPGAGRIVRSTEHCAALEHAVLSAFTAARPCEAKANRPPGPEALAEAAELLGAEGREVLVDLAGYAELARVTR